MSTERSTAALGGRLDATPRMAAVAAGDLLLLVGVIAVGVYNHSGLAGVTDPLTVADAAVPFLLGWALAALVVGVYRESALASVRRAVVLTAGAWLVADVVGQLIRGTPYFGGNADPVFFVVLLVVGGGVLTLWRTLATRL